MRAQTEKAWIIGLGAVVAVLFAVLVIVLVTEGGDDAAGQPAVTIENLSAMGYDAVIDFTVRGYDGPSAISIDWGDGSSPLALRGAGAMSASHTYSEEPVERVVVVTVTSPDGTVVSSSRALVLGGGGEPISATSTTEDPDSTTTTEGPAGATTSTTTPPAPERPTIQIELVPGNAAFDQEGTGEGFARLEGRTVSLRALTQGDNPEAVRTATLTWTIRAAELEGLTGDYQVRARLEPTWSVNLQASVNPGRAANWFVDFEASTGDRDLGGSSDSRSVNAGDEELFEGSDPFGFGTVVDGEELGDVVVTLVITCQAVPGTTIWQIGESSECHAMPPRGFNIDYARVVFAPVD